MTGRDLALPIVSILSVLSCGKTDKPTTVAGYTMLDDMEGQGGRIAWSPPVGQSGFWSSSTDCAQGDRILPVPYFVSPSSWSYDPVPEPYVTMAGRISSHAVHLRTKPGQPLQAIWGANVGFDFMESAEGDGLPHLPSDPGIDAGTSTGQGQSCRQGSSRDFVNGMPVSLRAYSGLTFWAMAGPGGRQSIRVQLNDANTDPRANLCSSSISTDKDHCYNGFGKAFLLTDTLTQYALDFSELRQQAGWGYRVGLDPVNLDQVYSLSFLVPLPGCTQDPNGNCAGISPPVSFDIWIDDIYFVNAQ